MTKKTQLNKARREIIEEYGIKHIESSIDRTRENSLLQQLIEFANEAIRAKYPEADMTVLRKYDVVRTDRCLRFQFPSGRIDGWSFPPDAALADMPSYSGCYSGQVFAVSAQCEQVHDAHASEHAANYRIRTDRISQFTSFVAACRTVEDVLEVVDLPPDIRHRLGHRSTALVAVSPETVTALRETFKIAA
ncbi:MAG TPA: hypothetical protein VKU02_19755 [Gemmataceae bacterium]|nr:hypothetical protein [Gemmataceae bacterium]